jgi:nicotinic acid phosphoribosyltransferase
MNNKDTLLQILNQAKNDYEASIKASKNFITRRFTFKKLKTNAGLCEYFQQALNSCNIVDKHLQQFKPANIIKDKWYPLRIQKGLELRLDVIEKAIAYYETIDEKEVELVLRGSYTENAMLYSAFEQSGFTLDDDYVKDVYLYFQDNDEALYGEVEDY